MSKNDIIAEYVKQNYPEILTTTDFAIFSFHMVVTDFAKTFSKVIKQVKFEKVKKPADQEGTELELKEN